MSTANRTAVRVVPESAYNQIPATPAFQELLYNSHSLAYAPKNTVSNAIIADRQITDSILTGYDTSGDIVAELNYGGLDVLWPGAMFDTWHTKPTLTNLTSAGTISAVNGSTNAITVTAGGAAYLAGFLVLGTGFGGALNNQVHAVVSSTGTSITTDATLVTEATPPVGATLKTVGFGAASGDIMATTTGISSTALDFTTLGLHIGEWIKFGSNQVGNAFATAANTGWARISAIAMHALTLDILPVGWMADAGTGKTIRFWFGDYLRNGVIEQSYSMELDYQDMATEGFEYYSGMEVKTAQVQLNSQSIPTITMSFMGANSTIGTTRTTGASTLAVSTNPVLNTSSNVAMMREGGILLGSPNYVTAATFSIENNQRSKTAIGSLATVGLGTGRCDVTGTLSTYFGDITLLNKLRNNTLSSLDFVLAKNGAGYVVDMPNIKYTSEKHPVSGIDTDIMCDLNFQALKSPMYGYTIHLQRMAYFE